MRSLEFGIASFLLIILTLQMMPGLVSAKESQAFNNHSRYNSGGTTTVPQVDNTTTAAGNSSSPSWVGFVAASVAVVFFGSNFVPVKKFDTGDGVFFQWVLCVAIWSTGFVVNCVQNYPRFYGMAMLGGVLWSTGNLCVVPIIKTIGLGLGILIWGSFNLLSGWASGRFGWFGLKPEPPTNPAFNTVSIVLAMLAAVFWVMVKSDTSSSTRNIQQDEEGLLDGTEEELETSVVAKSPQTPDDESWMDRLSSTSKRILGCTLALFSGILYGLAFTPVIHIKDNYPGASQTENDKTRLSHFVYGLDLYLTLRMPRDELDLDYVFAHFCGILLTSTGYFVLYCMIMKNKPKVFPQAILPGIVSGWMWGVADISWFLANEYLTEAVSFPIVTTVPGIIASLWGVLVYKEVRGRRNFIIMGIAYTLTITGAVFAGLSKK